MRAAAFDALRRSTEALIETDIAVATASGRILSGASPIRPETAMRLQMSEALLSQSQKATSESALDRAIFSDPKAGLGFDELVEASAARLLQLSRRVQDGGPAHDPLETAIRLGRMYGELVNDSAGLFTMIHNEAAAAATTKLFKLFVPIWNGLVAEPFTAPEFGPPGESVRAEPVEARLRVRSLLGSERSDEQ